MKVSERWLREWVDPPVDTAGLARQLTMAGLEVEAVEPAAPAFTGVVVAEVLAVAPHPDADRLRVCQVNTGGEAPLEIVCGAANAAPGMKVPCATVGAVLPDGTEIKKTRLRGVASAGMLCSARELGLAEEAEGLMVLDPDAPAGADLRAVLALDDHVIELGLTPNRGDCLGMEGVAREVAVINRMALNPPPEAPVAPQVEDALPVRLEAPAACPRYVGRVVRGVDPAAPTPLWMAERLRRAGLRSLGPLVDVTNYVMLELGQPMHAFDLGRLAGGITVRMGRPGETLTLLDGQEVEPGEATLVIADDSGPVALAGIMGGAATAVGPETTDIFLESAFFAPEAVAGRARAFGLHTDSSHRFERGVAPDLQERAMERATALLVDIAGGRPGPLVVETRPGHLPPRPAITLRRDRIARLLGCEVPDAHVEDILTRLGMQVTGGDRTWEVVPPAFRFDIGLEADLVEEVARIWGYGEVPATRPRAELAMGPRPEARVAPARWRALLADRGWYEAVTYSFVDPELQRMLDPETPAVALANPLAADMAVMRTSLWPGLLKAAQYNLHRQQEQLSLFEYGLKFTRQDTEIIQEPSLAGVAAGVREPRRWDGRREALDFFDLKGDVEALLALTGRRPAFAFEAAVHPALHPGQSARVLHEGRPMGWVGRLHPRLERALDLPRAVYLFELDAAALAAGRLPRFVPLSRFPAIRRDLAIVVDETVPAADIQRCIREAAPPFLTEIEVFDVYRGEGIDSGRKSLALGLTLQDLSRTLTDTDVEAAVSRILGALERQLGATLRE